jgi:hypothetical protein
MSSGTIAAVGSEEIEVAWSIRSIRKAVQGRAVLALPYRCGLPICILNRTFGLLPLSVPFETITDRSASDRPRPFASLQDRPCERARSNNKAVFRLKVWVRQRRQFPRPCIDSLYEVNIRPQGSSTGSIAPKVMFRLCCLSKSCDSAVPRFFDRPGRHRRAGQRRGMARQLLESYDPKRSEGGLAAPVTTRFGHALLEHARRVTETIELVPLQIREGSVRRRKSNGAAKVLQGTRLQRRQRLNNPCGV